MQVELVCRVAVILLQTHYHQLISTPSARPLLSDLKDVLHARVKVFYNVAFGLDYFYPSHVFGFFNMLNCGL